MHLVQTKAWINPDWPVPFAVRAACTTRSSGESRGVYAANNLAMHVGDNEQAVLANRAELSRIGALPSQPNWLTQTHSNVVVDCRDENRKADAIYTNEEEKICVVMTADCLPILLCDKQGKQVAAVHAGWRGLANNIVENTLARFQGEKADIFAWLGPAIGKESFEVGQDVYDVFVRQHSEATDFFQKLGNDKYLADLPGLAKFRLMLSGVTSIYGGEYCTYTDSQNFYSYRRDGVCGRMASVIWLDK